MGPTGSTETPAHNFQYALSNNKDVRRSYRKQYGALLNWNTFKLSHIKNLYQYCATESIHIFRSQVRQI
jgi:hypothetical protein